MSIDRWMDKEALVHIYKQYYSAIKKECIWISSTEVDEPRDYYPEWSMSEEKNKYHMLIHIYGI